MNLDETRKASRRAAAFLRESLSAYEMAHRGYRASLDEHEYPGGAAWA